MRSRRCAKRPAFVTSRGTHHQSSRGIPDSEMRAGFATHRDGRLSGHSRYTSSAGHADSSYASSHPEASSSHSLGSESASGLRERSHHESNVYSSAVSASSSVSGVQSSTIPTHHLHRESQSSRGASGGDSIMASTSSHYGSSAPPTGPSLSSHSQAANRRGALQRLGPKLRVSDRLGYRRSRSPLSRSVDGLSNSESSSLEITVDSGHDFDQRKVKGKKQFIRLHCIHCNESHVTFSQYTQHLRGSTHSFSMQDVQTRLKLKLGKLRMKQRKDQQRIEAAMAKDGTDVDENGVRRASSFCHLCRLAHLESSEQHQATQMHKIILDFMQPSCDVCKQKFFSPLAYESHKSSIIHLKAKAGLVSSSTGNDNTKQMSSHKEADYDRVKLHADESASNEAAKAEDNDDNGNGDDISEFDVSEFVTLDEVGEFDEHNAMIAEENDEAATSPHLSDKASQEAKPQPSEDSETNDSSQPVGTTFVRTVEMLYCDLCHKYLPNMGREFGPPPNKARIDDHCLTPSHRKAFMEKCKSGGEAQEEEKALQGIDARPSDNLLEETLGKAESDGLVESVKTEVGTIKSENTA